MDLTRNLERGHMITLSFGQQPDQDEHQQSNASLTESSENQDSLNNPDDQVLPGEGKLIKILKPTLVPAPVDELPCVYQEMGCKKTFSDGLILETHNQRCVFSLLYACKNPKCIAIPIAPFKSLDELVQHALNQHGCVPVVKGELINNQGRFEAVDLETYQRANQGDETLVPICLENHFFNPTSKEFTAKVVATYEERIDEKKFQVAFFAVDLPGNDHVFIIPIVYGKFAHIWNYGRMKLSLINYKGNQVRPLDPIPHPSHRLKDKKELMCLAFGEIKSLSNAIKKNTIAKFAKADLISVEATTNQTINFCLSVKAYPYRCITKTNWENQVTSLPRFLITEEELEIRADVQKLLNSTGESDDHLSIPGILMPLIRAKRNLMVACTEQDLIMSSVMASCLDYPQEYSATGARQPTILLLFPSNFMLEAIGASLQTMAKSIGLICAVIGSNFIDDNNDQASILLDNFKATGCNILATTPTAFLNLHNRNIPELNQVLLIKMKLIAFPNSDYLIYDGNATIAKNCIEAIRKEVNCNVHRIAFSPLISPVQDLLVTMSVFGEDKPVTLLLGTDYLTQVAQLPVIPLRITNKEQKNEMIINLLRTHPKDKRWLILTSGSDPCYKNNFISLFSKIQNIFPERRILWRTEETDTNPSCFDQFENDASAILLTTYYALQYDAIKSCEGIIIFGMPRDDADIVRLIPLARTLDKPIYSTRDSVLTMSNMFEQF